MTAELSPRQRWVDAVWDDEALTSNQRLVALAFAKYAGDGIDRVWVDLVELQRITKLSRATAVRAMKDLQVTGWLVQMEKARQHRAPRYRLTVARVLTQTPLTSPSVLTVSTLSSAQRAQSEHAETPRVLTDVPQRAQSEHRTSKRVTRAREHARDEPRCSICSKTQQGHDAAEQRVGPDDRHEFEAMAA